MNDRVFYSWTKTTVQVVVLILAFLQLGTWVKGRWPIEIHDASKVVWVDKTSQLARFDWCSVFLSAFKYRLSNVVRRLSRLCSSLSPNEWSASNVNQTSANRLFVSLEAYLPQAPRSHAVYVIAVSFQPGRGYEMSYKLKHIWCWSHVINTRKRNEDIEPYVCQLKHGNEVVDSKYIKRNCRDFKFGAALDCKTYCRVF